MVSRRQWFDRGEDREGSKETPSLVGTRYGERERGREKVEKYKSETERERES